ncbi:type IV pilus twitching motility protein PilT [Lacisediminihabitans profunda]|uniref:type IV pilus twitching motility protein PilT n=1 Tax=Lacisediminihabitans profunda TaxID=2594790 RepID=UPI002482BC67|nr:type IV pilus twitching motility protein PilT [Lacisediminihabitans profunda]
MDKPIYEIPVIGPGGEPIVPPKSSPVDYPPPGAHSFRLTEPQSASAPPQQPPAHAYAPPAPVTYPPPAAATYPPPSQAFPPPAPEARAYTPPTLPPYISPADTLESLAEEVLAQLPPPEYTAPPEDYSPGGSSSHAPRENADPDLVYALQQVVLLGASDLHLTSNAPPMIRIDGGLRPIEDAPVWGRERVANAIMTLLTPQQQEKFETELELDLAYTISANARFRVNVYQQRGAIGAAFRLIPTVVKSLKELGIPEVVSRFADLARGLVLVTGPTGSGKSTTLAALIDLVNRNRADHIVTVEDPIEFMHKHQKSVINQREVGSDTHSFANALKHVLRQDPDVILIGELRDLETISVALTAAETGHLVFATLHTQDASQTIDRVIDVFPPHQQGQVRAQLAATLNGVVCQTLVKRASGSGRAVATEVMMATPAIANLIREGKTYQIPSAMQAGRELGMHTMDQHLADLVNSGIITHQAALEKAHDRDGINRLIQRVESPTEASGRALASGGIDFGDSFSGEAR